MFKVLKVTGSSLSPLYQEGDFVLVTKIPFFLISIKIGDIIVFNHPDFGIMIKKVAEIAQNNVGYVVDGIHKNSVNRHQIGIINKESLIGKVIWHFSRSS